MNTLSHGKSRYSRPVIYSDGTTGTMDWVPEAIVIQRIRRSLRKQNRSLRTIRAGKEYAVIGASPISSIGLSELGRQLGVLAAHEYVEPDINRGWLHYIARKRVVRIEGRLVEYHDRLTRDYTTQEAARKAGKGIENREGLIMCSYDASPRTDS